MADTEKLSLSGVGDPTRGIHRQDVAYGIVDAIHFRNYNLDSLCVYLGHYMSSFRFEGQVTTTQRTSTHTLPCWLLW